MTISNKEELTQAVIELLHEFTCRPDSENMFLEIFYEFMLPIFLNVRDVLLDQDKKLEELFELMKKSRVVIINGDGRSLYVARVFGNRFSHIVGADENLKKLLVFVRGDTTAQPVSKDCSVIVVSGSGETPVVLTSAEEASKTGAKLIVFSSDPNSSIAKLANVLIIVPGRNLEESEEVLPMGTKFEITVLIILEIFNAFIIRTDNVVEVEKSHFNC